VISRITDILREKSPTFSFEVFPPKTKSGMKALFGTIEDFMEVGPDYVSVTYGAGGSTSRSTLEIVRRIQDEYGLTAMHHFTLVNQTVDELTRHIKAMRDAGVKNILALRGDPPKDMGGEFRKIPGGLEYCYELIDLIRDICGESVAVGVAGFPECHPDCPSPALDSHYLKVKLDHGADFVVTQFFFENRSFTEYLHRNAAAGAHAPVIPGILPVTDYGKLLKFCDTCGAYICDDVHRIFAPIADDLEATGKKGTDYAVAQCTELIRRGAAGIHFYCLNRTEPVKTIWRAVKESVAAQAA